MKKVLAIMIASLVFFWAQPSAALVVATSATSSLPLALKNEAGRAPAIAGAQAGTPRPDAVQRAHRGPEAAERAHRPGSYGLLALGLLAVALRRRHLTEDRPA